ncbi:hypothetical protein [Streptomyces sp. NPDC056061]|uniref:hypothetical protein n=1 Tax=Streptomyces sp. NPDC056061 TaxID=3345700 RepID=UPI0035D7C3F3
MRPPAPGLTVQQRQIVGYRAIGFSLRKTAAQLDLSYSTTRQILLSAQDDACVKSTRVLVYQSVASEAITLEHPAWVHAAEKAARMSSLTRHVWAGLRLNTADGQDLATAIARTSGQTRACVESTVSKLRTTWKLDECGLVGLAYAAGVLRGVEEVEPAHLAPGVSRSQREALTLLADDGSTYAAVDDQLGAAPGTAAIRLRPLGTRWGLSSLSRRIMLHGAFLRGVVRAHTPTLLAVEDPSAPTVVSWLGLDVADHQLPTAIAERSGLRVHHVTSLLNQLLAHHDLADLLRLGFTHQLLPRTDHTPARLRRTHLLARHQPAPAGPITVTDPLELLPPTYTAGTRHQPRLSSLISRAVEVGLDVQAVRMSPEVCREFLRRMHLPTSQWGPVLVDAEERTVWLLLRAASVLDRWCLARCRPVRPGAILPLPAHTTPTNALHWLYPPTTWWEAGDLHRALGHSTDAPDRPRNP